MAKNTERTVRHGVFLYHAPETHIVNGEEKEIFVEKMAFHNETIDVVRDLERERGDQLGAFWTKEEAIAHYESQGVFPPPGLVLDTQELPEPVGVEGNGDDPGPDELSAGEMSHSDLVDWLMATGAYDGQKKPTASEVVEAAEGDSQLAQRLLTAENEATANTPRVEVAKGLQKLIDG